MNNLTIIEHQNQRVLLTSQLAESYGTTNKVISNNFNNNKERYKEGKHYYVLEDEKKKIFIRNCPKIKDGLKNAKTVYLWTERGAFLHAKSLNTDKAWEVYDSLVEHYFQSQSAKPAQLPTNYKEAIQHLLVQIEENEQLQQQQSLKIMV